MTIQLQIWMQHNWCNKNKYLYYEQNDQLVT